MTIVWYKNGTRMKQGFPGNESQSPIPDLKKKYVEQVAKIQLMGYLYTLHDDELIRVNTSLATIKQFVEYW